MAAIRIRSPQFSNQDLQPARFLDWRRTRQPEIGIFGDEIMLDARHATVYTAYGYNDIHVVDLPEPGTDSRGYVFSRK